MFHSGDQATAEKRREPRLAAKGNVRILLEGPIEAEILGRLLDTSVNGFRAAHGHAALNKGDTVRFQHPSASGRARVIWNRITADTVETGFLIVPA